MGYQLYIYKILIKKAEQVDFNLWSWGPIQIIKNCAKRGFNPQSRRLVFCFSFSFQKVKNIIHKKDFESKRILLEIKYCLPYQQTSSEGSSSVQYCIYWNIYKSLFGIWSRSTYKTWPALVLSIQFATGLWWVSISFLGYKFSILLVSETETPSSLKAYGVS